MVVLNIEEANKNTRKPRLDISTLDESELRRLEANAHERILQAKTVIALSHVFWGYLLCSLEPKAKHGDYGTMATDGYYLYFDPYGYIHEWDDVELQSVIIHEISHCAFGHYWRCGGRNPRIWNMATDYVINWLLVNNEGLRLPNNPQCLYDNKYDEQLSAEAVYADLMKDRDAAMEMLKQALDDPDLFEECVNQANGGGDSEGEGDGEGDGHGHGQTSVEELTGGLVSEKELRNEDWWRDKVQSARTYAKSRGEMPDYLEQIVGDFTEPQLPWRSILREFITDSHTSDYRTLPPNKKYVWLGAYMPSIRSDHLELAVAIDTSGSISDNDAQQFLSEVRSIADAYDSFEIHYMQCDADVKFYQVLTNEDEDDWPMQIVGRGGTRFEPVFKKLEDEAYEPPILIYLTDLMGSFPPEPAYPVLWVSNNERSTHPWGDRMDIDINDTRN